MTVKPLPPDMLRWVCDPASFDFRTTEDVEPVRGVVGQADAILALQFGLECHAYGQNMFVRGLSGTGRMMLVHRLITELNPTCPLAPDRVYVHDFDNPMRPRLLTLPRGDGLPFSREVDQLVHFIEHDLAERLSADGLKSRVKALEQSTEESIKAAAQPLESSLAEQGLALVTTMVGQATRPTIVPLVNGQPVAPEVLDLEHSRGNVPDAEYQRLKQEMQRRQGEAEALHEHVGDLMERHMQTAQRVVQDEVRAHLRRRVNRIQRQFTGDAIRRFLAQIIDDLVTNRLDEIGEGEVTFTDRYRVNPIQSQRRDDGCPTIVENAPTLSNLMGGIDRRVVGEQREVADHLSIRGGSLLRADGGYLIVEARDLLSEPGSWRALMRALRARRLEVTWSEPNLLGAPAPIKPEPIDINVKVILVGDPDVYEMLSAIDPDFEQLFKVLAEFDTVTPRDAASLNQYASVLRRIVDEDRLPPFDRTAVAALAEHGARIAASRGRLTTRFNRIADIAREAGFLAEKAGRGIVTADEVRETVRRTKRRAGLSLRKFRELRADGTIRLQTSGRAVGQVNGLAVMQTGLLTYGFPARITATIAPGSSGVINIERESDLSGAIHNKGFLILGGLLRTLLSPAHPLAFDASIAFEQSYGGIDGDSASGAEICCLLSALTQWPIRQDLAMTGAIDQVGSVLAIGGVNEKIEGFYDTCLDQGLSGTQGVLIPRSNAGDLMLRDDVVEACREGRFNVYAVDSILQAVELMFDAPAGTMDAHDVDETTVLGRARARAAAFWEMSIVRRTSDV
ncbi:MAG: AAA family ATPase [Phycisphaerales bacterium]|nr:AAA family ATPase [Phycisphaerales bacterium]